MKSIKFSDDELEFLKEQYTEELANAEQYVDQIKEILKKLDVPIYGMIEARTEKQKKKDKKKERKAKAKAAELEESKKRSRRPKVTLDAIVSAVAAESFKKQEAKNPESRGPQKRGRKPKIVIPSDRIAVSNPIEPARIEEKMILPKTKKEVTATKKVKAEKNSLVNAAAIPVAEPKAKQQSITNTKAKIEKKPVAIPRSKPKLQPKTVSTSETKKPLKKEIMTVSEKMLHKEQKPVKTTTRARASIALSKQEPVAEPITPIPPVVEPVVTPTNKDKK